MDIEEWKPIAGYEGLYEVSSLGRVRSVDCKRTHLMNGKSVRRTQRGKVLKQCFDGQHHYLHVGLCKDGVSRTVNVHRLVAMAFVENPHGLQEINHIDEDKTNNRSNNLEWCNHEYNNHYGGKIESIRGERNGASKINAETFKAIRNEYIPYDTEHGITGLAKKYGISVAHVFQIVNRKRWGWLD